MPRGLVAMARSGGYCPLRVSGGILCSERGQSRDAFQAMRLEETSPRCNKYYYTSIMILGLSLVDEKPLKHTIDFILCDQITNDQRNVTCAYNGQVNIQY